MVKRCLVAVSAVVILIPVLCFSVFADDTYYQISYYNSSTSNWWGGIDVSVYSTVNDGRNIVNINASGNLFISGYFSAPFSVKIVNNSDYQLIFTVAGNNYGADGISVGDVITIDGNSSYTFTWTAYSMGGAKATLITFTTPMTIEPPRPFSVWDTTPLFPIISALYTFISGNSVLVVLFFIGVAVSLGFVTIRIIRKTMWSK